MLLSILGGCLVVVTLYDLAATVIGVGRGAGPITAPVAKRIWGALLKIHEGSRHPKMLRRSGPSILVTIFVMWVSLLILGWSMVFGASDAVIDVDADEPLAFLGKLYFAAATVIGRGTTTGRPSGDLWQALEEVAGVSGILLLSLAIAYIIPVIQAVVAKRQIALYIWSLGETPEQMLENAWNGSNLGDLDLHLVALTPMVTGLAQRHLAYPIVHYFHSSELETAIGPAIVALDEMLTLNERVVHPDHRMPNSATIPLRNAITHFLNTLDTIFIEGVEGEIAVTSIDKIRRTGVPVTDDLPEDPLKETSARRRLLRGYLAHDGWHENELLPGNGAPARGEGTEEEEEVDVA